MNDYRDSKSAHARVAPGSSPPELVVQIKAIACELPAARGLPLSRFSCADIVREAQQCGIVARDPDFALKAGRILDLYAKQWEGKRLRWDEFVLCADEKASIQARVRKHPTLPPRPQCAARLEHEYARAGAWAYLAALDVHRAKVFGRCEQSTGIDPFGRLVAQVMTQPPYRDARRVFWIMDNGSSHRGQPCVQRLTRAYPNLVPVHGPIHASWLNQIEIYFSIVHRNALTPNDFSCLAEVEDRLLRFQECYERMATPFDWRFTRDDLARLTKKFVADPTPLPIAALHHIFPNL